MSARGRLPCSAMESPRHPRFPVHRCAVRDGLAIGYWRAGEGGYPLLLVHGFPETKRIWARNVAPLAEAGFDVIVPDLRGVGDSDPAPDGFYDPPAYARDLRALCDAARHRALRRGRRRRRRDGGGRARAALPGLRRAPVSVQHARAAARRGVRGGGHPRGSAAHRAPRDGLLRAPGQRCGRAARRARHARAPARVRRRDVRASAAGPRRARSRAEDVAYHSEPFASAAALRAAVAVYEVGFGKRAALRAAGARADQSGADADPVRPRGPRRHAPFPARMAVAFPDHAGPFEIAGSGHFLSWEQPERLHDHAARVLPRSAADYASPAIPFLS